MATVGYLSEFFSAAGAFKDEPCCTTLLVMLYMVIENFKRGGTRAVGERFQAKGRLLPEGLQYHTSWMESSGARCFQIMETSDPALLKEWTSHWDDLIDFEITAVKTSAEYWQETRNAGAPRP